MGNNYAAAFGEEQVLNTSRVVRSLRNLSSAPYINNKFGIDEGGERWAVLGCVVE
ncbi:MAG: hypothetical protein IPN76_19405 [Saprospiraceae bacterium]|nr:hypothetical protein [Saprospiraceae bacterium]